jgi:hypothetical protein
MKFCKDCKWCRPKFGFIYYLATCASPHNPHDEAEFAVYGKIIRERVFCSTQRGTDDYSLCGTSGKWFGPKERT